MAWFAAAAPYLSAASAAVGVVGTIQAGQAAKATGEFNAKLSEREARLANQQAAREEEALRREQHSFFGKQRAAMAEAGLSPGGTTGLLADQSAVLAELDALNTRFAGNARGQGLLSDAAAARFTGRQSARSSRVLAGAQLLQGVGSSYRTSRALAGG